jgi:16S rRNA (guanine527-N7)-methyltransferase
LSGRAAFERREGVRVNALVQLLHGSGMAAEPEAVRQLEGFLALLRKWNARTNLTASTRWSALAPFVEEAVWAARLYPPGAVTHLDVGSGAGFPAIPLRILLSRLRLDLVEVRVRRSVFLETVVAELGLSDTRVFNSRLDRFLDACPCRWDCISWKGVKLSTRDLQALVSRATAETRFWMFHGRTLAAENPDLLEKALVLEGRHACPARKGWWLSEYRRIP